MNIILIYFVIKYEGDWDKVYKALEDKEKVSLKDISELEKIIEKEKWQITTILDLNYPKKLKEAYKPPFVIWIKGDINLLNNDFICLTGNQINDSILNLIKTFVAEVEEKFYLSINYFVGINDEIINSSKKSKLFILSGGMDERNFKISENDVLITEYPFGIKTTKNSLRARNRLISAFSNSLVLFSSEKNGGINNLVSNFLNLGKEIFCFPGDGSENDGNSELIKQGANLITSFRDLL